MIIKSIQIVAGYNGAVKIKAYTEEGKTLIMEKEQVEKYLLDMCDAKGFTTSLAPRQQYERLTINY